MRARIGLRTRTGFGLLEVLVALTIMSVSIVVLLGLFASLSKLGKDSFNTSTALYAAQEKLQQIVHQNVYIPTAKQTDTPPGFPTATRNWWGTADPADPAHVQDVTVEVDWTEGVRQRSLVLDGLVAP